MLINAHGVIKRFRSDTVLDGVDLTIDRGEIVGLAGVNGAGKTTFINLLMGFIEKTDGSLEVLGNDPVRRHQLGETGWMPERPRFPAHLKSGDVLGFQAATFPGWDQAHADELIERLGIDPGSSIRILSRGQLARLALVCALGHRPKILLLDDPTLGLDPGGRRLLLGELLASIAETGTGVLLATHLLAEADQALDRLAILTNRRILVDLPTEDLKQNFRELEIPAAAPPLPIALAAKETSGRWITKHWDEEEWTRYRNDVPEARTTRLDIESIFIALTGGSQ